MIRGTIDKAMHHDPAEALLAALLPILFGDPLPELVGVFAGAGGWSGWQPWGQTEASKAARRVKFHAGFTQGPND